MKVALTIDAEHPDWPSKDPLGNASRQLDLLGEFGVAASFFVEGYWARTYPDMVRRIAGDGHLIGSHSQAHCVYSRLHHDGIVRDLADSRASLETAGADPRHWFRLPSGEGGTDPEVMAAVSESGFRNVGWTVICGDWEEGCTAQRVVDLVLRDVEGRRPDGVSVPMIHSWPDPTPYALEEILRRLTGSVEFVRLDDLACDDIPSGYGLRDLTSY